MGAKGKQKIEDRSGYARKNTLEDRAHTHEGANVQRRRRLGLKGTAWVAAARQRRWGGIYAGARERVD